MIYKKASKLLSGFLSLLLLLNGLTFAYQANRDPSFGKLPDQEGLFDPTASLGYEITAMAVQDDGKILVIEKEDLWYRHKVIRLNSDGSVDNSFNTGDGFDGYDVNIIAIQNDGKILVGGDFTSYNGQTAKYIIKLNSDGSIDNSFDTGIGFNRYRIDSIAIQNDGKILVGGEFSSYNGQKVNGIVRLNSDGSIDNSFDTGIGFNRYRIDSIAIQNDGKILVGGDLVYYQEDEDIYNIIRLNSDGSIDNSFDIGDKFEEYLYIDNITIQNDGKILVNGTFYSGQYVNKIIRLNSDGSIDNSFDTRIGFNRHVNTIAIQNDEKILVGGYFTSYNGQSANGIIRLNPDGSIDNSFDTRIGFNRYVNTIAIQNDGKILVGVGGDYNILVSKLSNLIRLNPDGSSNTAISAGFAGRVYTITAQNDGKILIGGLLASYNGQYINNIIRLNSDGSIDNSFNTGNRFDGYYDEINTIAIQNDGKILVGGYFTSYNGQSANGIIRLNSDGSRDNSFDSGNGFNGLSSNIYTIAIQSDGKILVGGNFSSYNGQPANSIIRLNPDGSRDNSFNIGDGFDNYVNTITIQNDGKILVVGPFTSYNGQSARYIIRLNPDGSIDNSFDSGEGFNGYVNTIAIQEDGKILVGGRFTSYNGQSARYIIRLNPDGSIDNSFALEYEARGVSVASIALQNDGKILIGGGLVYHYEGEDIYNDIIRLNSDGSVDNSFNSGDGVDYGNINSISIQNDGKILVGGEFNSYKGQEANNIIRLIGTSPVYLPDSDNLSQIEEGLDGDGIGYEYTNEGGGIFMGERNISLQKTNGKILNNLNFLNDGGILSLPRNLQFKNNNGNNYTGIFTPPTSYQVNSVDNKDVISAIQVGNPRERLSLTDGTARVTVPIGNSNLSIGDPLSIYSSQDGNNRIYEKGAIVSSQALNGQNTTVASFTTNHFTYFAITENTEGVFLINNGDSSTDSQNVTLTISAPGASQMRFRNQGSSRSDREPYNTSKNRTLSEGFGNKTINAQFEIDGQIFDVSESILYGQEASQTGQEGQGHIRLSILGGETECVYGTSVNLGNQDSHLNPAGYIFTGDFAPANRYCSDYKGLEGRVFTIQTTDLTSQNGEVISGTNVFISHDTPAVQGDLSCTGYNGVETQFFASPLSLMEKMEQENNNKICRVDLENVKIKVNVPAYQAPGSYQGTLTITLPNGF